MTTGNPRPGAGTITADVIVIGAGVVGAATAYELSKRGLSVAVLETGETIGRGCSHANAGLLAPSHVEPLTTPTNLGMGAKYLFRRDSPFHISASPAIAPWLARFALASTPKRARKLTASMQVMARRSLDLHREYHQAGLATGFRQTGSLDVFLTERRFAAARAGVREGDGLTVLTAAQARQLEPELGQIAGAIRHPHDAVCDSRAFIRATLDAAARHGSTVHWGVSVSHLTTRGGRITGAQTSAGTVSADHVVVAAGLASAELVRPLGTRLDLLAGKGYVIDTAPNATIAQPLTFTELKVVATPFADRLRFCGTMDLGDRSSTLVTTRIDAIRRAARRGLPSVDSSTPIQTWAGHRPCTSDGIPVVGPSITVSGLHIGAGHGMWGVILAPISATVIADGVTGSAPDATLAEFGPARLERAAVQATQPRR